MPTQLGVGHHWLAQIHGGQPARGGTKFGGTDGGVFTYGGEMGFGAASKTVGDDTWHVDLQNASYIAEGETTGGD